MLQGQAPGEHSQDQWSSAFLCFSYDAPGAWPVWTRGTRLAGLIKRTFIHCYTRNRKALGLVVSEKKIFFMFFPLKAMGANDLRGGAIYDPRGMVGRIYKEDHYTLLHTKYESSGPCGERLPWPSGYERCFLITRSSHRYVWCGFEPRTGHM